MFPGFQEQRCTSIVTNSSSARYPFTQPQTSTLWQQKQLAQFTGVPAAIKARNSTAPNQLTVNQCHQIKASDLGPVVVTHVFNFCITRTKSLTHGPKLPSDQFNHLGNAAVVTRGNFKNFTLHPIVSGLWPPSDSQFIN